MRSTATDAPAVKLNRQLISQPIYVRRAMATLACTGRDNVVRTFEFRYGQEPLSGEWSFKVTTIPPPPHSKFFEMTLAPIGAQTLRVVMLNHFKFPPYVAMGIPEALLSAAKALLGQDIESSPSSGTQGGIYRTPDATKVWERLRQRGLATYDASRDVYTLA